MIAPPEAPIFGWNPTGDWGPLTIYTKRGRKPVFFLKSPPKSPPTPRQTFQRDNFRLVARLWQRLTQEQREAWHLASIRAHLAITGYNLFVYWQLTRDRSAIRTIEHQTNLELLT